MKFVKLFLWIGCLIHLVSSNDSSSQESKSASNTSKEDLGSANSEEDDASFVKNCSESKTISKRETDRLSQLDDDKDDNRNNGAGDMSPKRNSSMNLHEIPLTSSEKDKANTNETEEMTTTTATSTEDNSSEEVSSTYSPQEEDIIILPLPPRPVFIELIFFRTNRNSNGTSIGNFKGTDFSSEDISASFLRTASNETGSNLTRSGPHGAGLSDMKGSFERDETTGLEHVRLANSKPSTFSKPATMQTTASLDDGHNEDAVLGSTRNSDNFNSVESSSTILGKTESSVPAQKITRLHPSTPSPLNIGEQGLRRTSINSDEDADTNSGSGTHMSVTISGSKLQGKSNRGESDSAATASQGFGNRRRRDTIFSHLTNNSQTGSSEDGKHSPEKRLMVATSTTSQKSNNTNTDSNLPDGSAGESIVIVTGSSTNSSKLSNSTTSHGGNKGIIAAFMEILGLGTVETDDNNTGHEKSSNASSPNTTTPSLSNSNQNSTNGSSGQGRRVSRAANGPTGNSNPSSSPSPTSSTPNSVSSTSKPDGKSSSGANESQPGSDFIPPPLLNVPSAHSAGTNTTKFPTNQHN